MADFEVASAFPQGRPSERVQQHAGGKGVPRFREETVVGVRSGEAEVPEIIIVSDAVEGIFVDLDGEGVVLPAPQIAAKILEVVAQEHISDDLPVPQVVKENLEVIKVQQEREDVPQSPNETVRVQEQMQQRNTEETTEVVSLAPQERMQQRTVEEMVHLINLVKLVSQERVQQRTAETVAVVGLAPRERVQHRTAEIVAVVGLARGASRALRHRNECNSELSMRQGLMAGISKYPSRPRPAFGAYSGAVSRRLCRGRQERPSSSDF